MRLQLVSSQGDTFLALNNVSVLEYYLGKSLVQEQGLVEDFKKTISEVTSPEKLLKLNLSKLVTPEKLSQIVEQVKEKFPNGSYNHQTRELVLGGNTLHGLNKLLSLYWITMYYLLSSKEGLQDVSSEFVSKTVDVLKGIFVSKALLSNYDVNVEQLLGIFEKVFNGFPVYGLLCYLVGISVLHKDTKLGVSLLAHVTKLLTEEGDSFGTRLYYILVKSRKLIGSNVYVNSIADILYLELFAVGIVTTPLSILKYRTVEQNNTETSSTDNDPAEQTSKEQSSNSRFSKKNLQQ